MISRSGLQREIQKHPDCGDAAKKWFQLATKSNWSSLNEIRRSIPSADQVGEVLIFNLRGNDYRLMATVHYPSRTLYVKALLSHAGYDRKEWMKWA